MESLNRGKAAYIYGVTIEHFLHGGNELLQKVTDIIKIVFHFGWVTEGLQFSQPLPRLLKHC